MTRRSQAAATVVGAVAAFVVASSPECRAESPLGLDDPRLEAMARSVMANPAQMRRYVALARSQPEKAGAPILLLAGKYELGRGRYAAADRFFTQAIALGGEGPWRAVAESGLGWAALGRGDFAEARRHYVASGLADFDTIVVVALIDAAAGDARAIDVLTPLASGEAPPELADVTRLALGYAHLWTGNADVADAAFATVTGELLLDDAGYARGRLLARRGDADGARAMFTALVDGSSATTATRPSRALLELTPSAVIRSGLRRTSDTPITSQHEQLLTVIDGDGVMLARTALHREAGHGERRGEGNGSDPMAFSGRAAEWNGPRVQAGREHLASGAPPAARRHFAPPGWVVLLLIGMAVWWIKHRLFAPPSRRP